MHFIVSWCSLSSFSSYFFLYNRFCWEFFVCFLLLTSIKRPLRNVCRVFLLHSANQLSKMLANILYQLLKGYFFAQLFLVDVMNFFSSSAAVLSLKESDIELDKILENVVIFIENVRELKIKDLHDVERLLVELPR